MWHPQSCSCESDEGLRLGLFCPRKLGSRCGAYNETVTCGPGFRGGVVLWLVW